jgi:hypothetical protein
VKPVSSQPERKHLEHIFGLLKNEKETDFKWIKYSAIQYERD